MVKIISIWDQVRKTAWGLTLWHTDYMQCRMGKHDMLFNLWQKAECTHEQHVGLKTELHSQKAKKSFQMNVSVRSVQAIQVGTEVISLTTDSRKEPLRELPKENYSLHGEIKVTHESMKQDMWSTWRRNKKLNMHSTNKRWNTINKGHKASMELYTRMLWTEQQVLNTNNWHVHLWVCKLILSTNLQYTVLK